MRRTSPALLLVTTLLPLALGGCGSGGGSGGGAAPSAGGSSGGPSGPAAGGASLIDVTGTVTTKDFQRTGSSCASKAADLRKDATVVVATSDGSTLANGRVAAGSVVGGSCRFRFTVDGVAAGWGDYLLAVGDGAFQPVSEAALHKPVAVTVP